jgi:Phosphoesterase family
MRKFFSLASIQVLAISPINGKHMDVQVHVGRSHVNNAPDMESQTIYPTHRIPGLALRAFTLSAPCPSSNHRRLVTLNLLVLLALASSAGKSAAANPEPTTPIRHVVVIYDENISFDHYFGTYPRAANGPGEVPFHASSGTPSVNGLSGVLLSRNPNSTNPFRLDRAKRGHLRHGSCLFG